MLICFFNSQDVVNKEFVPQEQTVNQQYYDEVLEWLRKWVHHVQPDCRHLDAASRKSSITMPSPWTNFWPEKVFQWFRSPPFSPDLSPCDLFLFPKLKFHLKGRHFGTVDNIQKVVQTSLGHFHMKTSSTPTGWESNVSGGVWLPKGTTLKGIIFICSSVVNKKFYSTSLVTF